MAIPPEGPVKLQAAGQSEQGDCTISIAGDSGHPPPQGAAKPSGKIPLPIANPDAKISKTAAETGDRVEDGPTYGENNERIRGACSDGPTLPSAVM